jgi:hypothetical protein
MKCALSTNRVVPCSDDFIASEGLCVKHAVLFDFWVCERQGYRVYQTDYPLNWKRSKVHQWLNILGNENAEKILNS